MTSAFRKILRRIRAPKSWDDRRVIALCAIALCATCVLSFALKPTLAAFTASTSMDNISVQSRWFKVAAMDETGAAVTESQLSLKSLGTPYVYTLQSEGDGTGYCKVTVRHSDNSVSTSYIYPIASNEEVYLVLYAAAGANVEFEYGLGSPPSDVTTVTPFSTYASRDEDAASSVYLEVSETPYVEYEMPARASIEQVSGHYRTSIEDILTFNEFDCVQSIQTGSRIFIPNPSTETAYEPPIIYKVVSGDTLYEIAQKFNVTISSIRAWNELAEDAEIYPNLELTIPVLYENVVGKHTTPVEEPEEPASTEPANTEPETTEPETTEPETTEPETTEPETTEPETTEPETTEPETTEPKTTEPSETETDKKETDVFVKAEDGTLYVNGVPLYYQGDYPKCLYGNGTVATSGCSVTSLTMVANAITGYDYTVDELADYFGGCAENNMARLEIGSKTLGLSFYKSENWHKTWEALQEGKIVVALMEETSMFTDSQHFIVLTGLSEDGERVYVNDPNKDNYTHWDLKKGFEEGFTENEMLQGYSGAWVYDRTLAVKPARYSEDRVDKTIISEYFTSEKKEVLATNYPEIHLNLEERELLAKVIWAEARGECEEGQQAVAEVVLNRMLSEQFGDTLNDVIYSEGQFRSVPYLDEAEPSQAQYQAIDRALFGTPVLNRNVYYFATYLTNSNTYMQIGKHIFCYRAVEDRQ